MAFVLLFDSKLQEATDHMVDLEQSECLKVELIAPPRILVPCYYRASILS